MSTFTKATEAKPLASWYHGLHAISRAVQDTRKRSENERTRGKAMRLEMDSLAKFDQLDTNIRLQDRITCLREWICGLKHWEHQLKKEVNKVSDTKTAIEEFMARLADIILVNVECVTHRDIRKNGEYLLDPVQDELQKENQLMLNLQKDLQSALDDATEQLRMMLESLNDFVQDIANKEAALNIDITLYNKNGMSNLIGLKPFCMRRPKEQVDLQFWDDMSRARMDRSRKEIEKGLALKEVLQDLWNQTIDKLIHQASMVSEKLRRSVYMLKTAINELEVQRKSLEDEHAKLLRDIASWGESKRAKILLLKLVQSRMEARLEKPGSENLRDAAHFGMEKEIKNLKIYIDGLDEQIAKGREHSDGIGDRLGLICHELKIKKDALRVEENIIRIRQRLDITPAKGFPSCAMVKTGIIRQMATFY